MISRVKNLEHEAKNQKSGPTILLYSPCVYGAQFLCKTPHGKCQNTCGDFFCVKFPKNPSTTLENHRFYLKAGLLNFENENYRERYIFYSCPGNKYKETLQEDETFYVCQSGVELFRKSNRIKKYSYEKIEKYF